MQWKNPPAITHRERMEEEVIPQLKTRPGVWALVEERQPNPEHRTMWKDLGCDCTTRRRTDGEGYDIYARWPELPSQKTPVNGPRPPRNTPSLRPKKESRNLAALNRVLAERDPLR